MVRLFAVHFRGKWNFRSFLRRKELGWSVLAEGMARLGGLNSMPAQEGKAINTPGRSDLPVCEKGVWRWGLKKTAHSTEFTKHQNSGVALWVQPNGGSVYAKCTFRGQQR